MPACLQVLWEAVSQLEEDRMAQLVLILLQISILSFSCFSFYCDNPRSLRGLYCEHVLLKTGDWVDISVCVILLHYVNSTDKTNCFARFDIHAYTNGFNFKATVLNLTLHFVFFKYISSL